MGRLVPIAAICIAAALGFGVGRLSSGRASAAPPDQAASTALSQELAEMRRALEGMRGSLDRVSRRSVEVAATGTAVPAARACACPVETRTTPEDEMARAQRERSHPRMQEAETLVEDAIARGTWTEGDVERFRALARDAPEFNWAPLMQKIDVAINKGRLRPDLTLFEFH
jgi:hypothetical protein